MYDSLSEQQVFIMYGILTYLTVFPVLLVAAAVAGHLHRKAADRAAAEAAPPVETPAAEPLMSVRPAA